ncbi:glycosyl transferases group 1 family protein [Lyngbya aestuarii BL J]|uniref:Glycosyl transferases group 1 family protein n=2 Tax=Lyngbya aestuarii TaxID=118322 RepID=U7QBB4_9CYAN|nr:glycosyl transferases group 1 family protein [Lyngbya aestuarii BL J]
MINETIQVVERGLLPEKDYVSPGLVVVQPDQYFPNMVVGDPEKCLWPYLRRSIPHNWYVDQRQPTVGFLSRDEAHIVYNTGLKFKNKQALEIGCWMGWSACHLALAGVNLDVIDPLLERSDFYESVTTSLRNAGVLDQINLVAGYSPKQVEELANQFKRKWSLIFIDGDHEAPGPLEDAMTCEKYAEDDAIILFHDLASPDVAQGLDYLRDQGWNTMVYQTMQIMGVAWRGNVKPVMHQPDIRVNWQLPAHLQGYTISNLSQDFSANEFREILKIVRPYTLLSEERLFSLYSLAKQVCLEDIPGNFVECGAYKGGASALIAAIIKRYTLRPRLLYAFDTFEGMPDPTDADLHNGIPANQTGFGAGTLDAPIRENLDQVCQLLDVRDIVKPVQGLFNETLPQYKKEIGDIAFLHADGDWYESTMDIFNNLYENVVFGGNIQVDDYGHWEGCKKAIHEFEKLQEESFNLHQIDYTGVWFRKGGDVEDNEVSSYSPTLCVDGVFFQLYNTGIARVWKSILEEWAKSDFAKYIVVLDRGGTAPQIPGIRYRPIPTYSYAATDADKEILQQVCDEEGADLFISTYYTTPISTPSVFMAYDMIPEVLGADFNEPMWREKHNAIRHASAYISISENTASDLVKCFSGISPEQVTVAHCGVSPVFSLNSQADINQFKMKYGITKPYFILVGAGSNYKNAGLFFQAFAQLYSKQGFEIVCTGGSSLWLSTEYRQFTSGCVVHPLQLSDEELSIAYSGATALVYPSLYEGFGMPVAEAMACGCPVITCKNSSIPEVAGEAAIYVNETDINAMANALCEVQKPQVRRQLIETGLQQAKKFSWQKMADIVSSALINATLQRLNLREINLIIFPDWTQDEESLGSDLAEVIKSVITHPDSSRMTLLIDNSNISNEEADLALSSIVMNLIMEEELEVADEPNISLIGQLSEIQWSALIPHLQGRIVLEHENQDAIKQTQAENIPTVELDSLNKDK